MRILTLCTGNVARSAMLGYLLADVAESSGRAWHVKSAGTHAIEGQAMSPRTRDALLSLPQLGEHHYVKHRSHQIDAADVAWADVILSAELDNVDYVRHHFSSVGLRCVQVAHFVAHAPGGLHLVDQLFALSHVPAGRHLDVADPAGGDQAIYDATARVLFDLARGFAALVD